MKKNALILVSLLLFFSVGVMGENVINVSADWSGTGIYDGTEQTITLTVTADPEGSSGLIGDKYTVEVKYPDGSTGTELKGTNAGDYLITVTGTDEYVAYTAGTITLTMDKLTLTESNFSISSPSDVTYNGEEQKPTIGTVSGSFGDLVEGTDFSVTWSGGNLTDAAKYTGTVTLSNDNYALGDGYPTISYTINQASISTATVTLSESSSVTYSGTPFAVVVSTVELSSEALSSTDDYDVKILKGGTEVTEIKDAGTYTFTVTGKGNYKDDKTEDFVVSKYSITSATIVPQTYTGSEVVIPFSAVAMQDVTLQEGDITITITKGGTDVGTENEATITALNTTNFDGEVENVAFEIVAAPVYYTINLTVGDGITANYETGDLTVGEGDPLFLIFRADDAETPVEDILFMVDDKVTEFRELEANRYAYMVAADKNRDVVIALKTYEVSFPKIEGVTFEGEPIVAYGEPYTFTFTLAESLNPDVIVYVNGEKVEYEALRATTYKVTIPEVTGVINISMEVEGVGNATVEKTSVVYSMNGLLVVEAATPQSVQVYSMLGALLANDTVNGQLAIVLNKGVYLVKVGKDVHKVVVK